jgi:hypothetical protein
MERNSVVKKYYCFALSLSALAWGACSSAKPVPGRASQVTVKNEADARPATIYWTATGCSGVDMNSGASGVCHEEIIASKQSASYTFADNTRDRSILLYRAMEVCALRRSELGDFRVSGDAVLRTDGCVLQKDSSESSMLTPTQR